MAKNCLYPLHLMEAISVAFMEKIQNSTSKNLTECGINRGKTLVKFKNVLI